MTTTTARTLTYYPRQTEPGRLSTPRTGRVVITLDLEAIYQEIGRKALRGKTGRATAYGSRIKAKVTDR